MAVVEARMKTNFANIILIFIIFCFHIHELNAKKSCVDRDHRCSVWSRDGKCSNKDVIRDCPKSCELCSNELFTTEDILRASIVYSSEKSIAIMIVFVVLTVIALLIALVKCFTCGAFCKSKGTMKGKIVVITGGTDGIGLETVFHLASRKARVIIGCRNLKKGFQLAKKLRQQTGQDYIEIKKLDLSSLDSVRDFAEECNELKHIDVLINNAGMISGKERCLTTDGYEETFQVNYLAHYLLTKLLIGKLKRSCPSRIINVVDEAYKKGKLDFSNLQGQKKFNNYQAYYNSKLALMLFTKEATCTLKGLKVTVNAANPGRSVTRLWRNCYPYNFKFLWLLMKPYTYLFWKPADMGAETTYYCSLDLDLETVSGKVFTECAEDVMLGLDDEVGRKLWEISERLIQPKRLSTLTKESVGKVLEKNANKKVDFRKQAEENSDHDTTYVLEKEDTANVVQSEGGSENKGVIKEDTDDVIVSGDEEELQDGNDEVNGVVEEIYEEENNNNTEHEDLHQD